MAPEPNSTTTPATSSPAQKGGKAKSAGETRVLQTRSAKAGLAVSLEGCETVDGEGFVGSLGWKFGLFDTENGTYQGQQDGTFRQDRKS
jgi:hypothetical protein